MYSKQSEAQLQEKTVLTNEQADTSASSGTDQVYTQTINTTLPKDSLVPTNLLKSMCYAQTTNSILSPDNHEMKEGTKLASTIGKPTSVELPNNKEKIEDIDYYSAIDIQRSNQTKKYLASLYISENMSIPVRVLFDSESEINIIPLTIFKKFRAHCDKDILDFGVIDITIKSNGERKSNGIGKIKIPLQTEKRTTKIEFVVFDIPEEIVYLSWESLNKIYAKPSKITETLESESIKEEDKMVPEKISSNEIPENKYGDQMNRQLNKRIPPLMNQVVNGDLLGPRFPFPPPGYEHFSHGHNPQRDPSQDLRGHRKRTPNNRRSSCKQKIPMSPEPLQRFNCYPQIYDY